MTPLAPRVPSAPAAASAAGRARLLDLFCGAGGCAVGYHRAGFDVVGVDNRPQPRYPFEFVQADALDYCREHGHEFDVIHASPPCQAYSVTSNIQASDAPMLIDAVREMLQELGRPYVIENVPGARRHMREFITLCGTQFGLGSERFDLQRHRHFEVNPPIFALLPPCRHRNAALSIFGHGSARWIKGGTRMHGYAHEAREAMGIDWMNRDELSQAIPPAYTEWVGRQMLAVVTRERIA